MEAPIHVSVLLKEVVQALVPEAWEQNRESYWLDGTLGLAGHAKAILEKAGAGARLIGFDKDGQARGLAETALHEFEKQVRIVASGFEDMKVPGQQFLGNALGYDGILLDLGISSLQLNSAERGFSFSKDAPLDMRMDTSSGPSAAEWLQGQSEASLKQVLFEYADEHRAGAIARSILKSQPKTTLELANAVLKVGWPYRETHPATKTFQAIRIAVNDELGSLKKALPTALGLLRPGGRLAIISFHSLEDRMVKSFFTTESTGCICPPSFPECRCGHKATLKKVFRKALIPQDSEIAANPRSRSAKLRVAEKL